LTVVVNRNGKNVKEIDLSVPPVSNCYGFVCFETAEDAEMVLNKGVPGLKIERYQSKIHSNDSPKIFNNVYVKNFDPDWNEEKLREVFKIFGEIKSVYLNTKTDKKGN
jgi:RNA recognition motif-containing protein